MMLGSTPPVSAPRTAPDGWGWRQPSGRCEADVGDERADALFAAELGALTPQLRRLAYRLAGTDDAEDLVQETLMKAWAHRQRLRAPGALAGWVRTIARNAQFSALKRKRYATAVLAQYPWPTVAAPSQEPAAELAAVAGRVAKLADSQREALLAVVTGHESYDEVAARLGLSLGALKGRIVRARQALSFQEDAGPRV